MLRLYKCNGDYRDIRYIEREPEHRKICMERWGESLPKYKVDMNDYIDIDNPVFEESWDWPFDYISGPNGYIYGFIRIDGPGYAERVIGYIDRMDTLSKAGKKALADHFMKRKDKAPISKARVDFSMSIPVVTNKAFEKKYAAEYEKALGHVVEIVQRDYTRVKEREARKRK